MVRRFAAYALSFAISIVAACDSAPGEQQAPPPTLSRTFDAIELPALYETDNLCVSWTLDNDEPLIVNSVSMTNSGGFHHSNWFFVADDVYDGPDGAWDCDERSFDSLTSVISGGVLAAWSTQARAETQSFPPGAGFEIPRHSRIVANLHVLNASDTPLTTEFSLDLNLLDPADLETRLNPMMLDYRALAIPPHARSRFEMSCDFATPNGAPLDFNIYYALPHYHALGAGSRFWGLGSDGAPSMLYEHESSIGEVLSASFDPPISAAGMTELGFGCEFMNDRDDTVGEGIGDQEMCILVAWTDSHLMWVGLATEASQPTGMDGSTQLFGSDCFVTYVQP